MLPELPIRRFKPLGTEPYQFLLKFRVYLEDKPGSLAEFSSLIGDSGCNISYFHYDRGLNACRVSVEAQAPDAGALARLEDYLRQKGYSFEDTGCRQDEVEVTTVENVMEIKVRLQDRPGTLGAFSRLLAGRGANVTYMLYDEDIDAESADFALATGNPEEIDVVLDEMNRGGYHYSVLYRGSDEEKVGHTIGLKLVEKFFIRLKRLLSAGDLDEVRSLVESSRELNADLVDFYKEAGKDLQAGDVYEKVLTLASRCRSRTGDRFSAVEMPPIELDGGITLHSFRLPTSENIFLFRHPGGLTLIDTGYGIYYEDIKKLLRARGFDPSMVKRLLVTHADADHAGSAGRFEEDSGTRVYMHPGSREVMASGNRAHGLEGGQKLFNLNKFYTRLINRFTDCRFPRRPEYFGTLSLPAGAAGAFDVIDRVAIDGAELEVLESKGGHISGCVFFLLRAGGLLFTSDYLIDPKGLSSEDRENLGVYSYLLTNPNRDSGLYKEECAALRELAAGLDAELRPSGRRAVILPGHGAYYNAGQS